MTERAVYKWGPLPIGGCTIDVQVDAVVRHVAEQNDCPTLWCEVTPGRMTEPWNIEVFATGEPGITDRHEYLGTAFCARGLLVWHVYRVRS